jgi:hypothetical protein
MSIDIESKHFEDIDVSDVFHTWLNKRREALEQHNIEFVHSVETGTLLRTWHTSELPNGVLVEITTPEGEIEHATTYYRTDEVLPSIQWWVENGYEISEDYQKSEHYDYSEINSEVVVSRII